MKFSKVCDKCKCSPKAFECGDDEKFDQLAFYHIIPRKCDDPITLMSSGALLFKLSTTIEHPILEEEAHVCGDCFTEMFGDSISENEEGYSE